jgi:RND family efflux transporter MFP subunit
MSFEAQEAVRRLAIPPEKKARRVRGPGAMIAMAAATVAVLAAVFAATQHAERQPVPLKDGAAGAAGPTNAPAPEAANAPSGVVLTVSGYVIPRERIEISPRFPGTVTWIGVKKGDRVRKNDVLVRLDDAEHRARLLEAEGRVALAEANLENAEANYKRQMDLLQSDVDSARAFDEAKRVRGTALADVKMAQGQLDLARTYLEWCTIRAPIDGTILEKLVNPNELVSPQSFGGAGGPSTAFLAMADLGDLQVEIDLNEADISKVALGQPCRVSPEAYPDRTYEGRVAEIAPEANRSKGTLQVKVQVRQPDAFLTPELTAKVDFLREGAETAPSAN